MAKWKCSYRLEVCKTCEHTLNATETAPTYQIVFGVCEKKSRITSIAIRKVNDIWNGHFSRHSNVDSSSSRFWSQPMCRGSHFDTPLEVPIKHFSTSFSLSLSLRKHLANYSIDGTQSHWKTKQIYCEQRVKRVGTQRRYGQPTEKCGNYFHLHWMVSERTPPNIVEIYRSRLLHSRTQNLLLNIVQLVRKI